MNTPLASFHFDSAVTERVSIDQPVCPPSLDSGTGPCLVLCSALLCLAFCLFKLHTITVSGNFLISYVISFLHSEQESNLACGDFCLSSYFDGKGSRNEGPGEGGGEKERADRGKEGEGNKSF